MRSSNQSQQVLSLFRKRDGYVTAAEIRAAGLPRVTLTRLVQKGEIIRLERGLYRLTDTDGLTPEDAEVTDLLKVQLRFLYAWTCLISALHLHGLTNTRPIRLQFAVPRSRSALNFEHLLLDTLLFLRLGLPGRDV